MYSRFQIAIRYFKYRLKASNGKGHGVHSPFVFDFISKLLNDKRQFYAYKQVEDLRTRLLHDETVIEVEDLGAGSSMDGSRKRKICDIAAHAAKPKKLGQLLFRIVNYYQPKHIVDIGTSLGLTTAYLSLANPDAKLVTMEGAGRVAAAALKNLQQLGIKNVTLHKGNFDDTLPAVIEQLPSADLVFFDGNHRKEPTLRYFETCLSKVNNDSVFIFDDIHWSSEMEEAWEIIKKHPSVRLSIDIFFIGLVFFKKEFKEIQHFSIRF